MRIPDVLIYNKRGTDLYKMVTPDEHKLLGRMIARPTVNRELEILELVIFNNRRKGLGTKFLDYAKKLSEQYGYEGHMVLNASTTSYDPHNPPHIFYRKYGFTANDKKMIKKIDKCIKKGKQLNYVLTPNLIMYYPDYAPPKLTFMEKIKRLFR